MRIFISYAHVDRQLVKNLAGRLRRYHDVWHDDRLHAGQDWWKTILQQLEWCECFIYVLTPDSLVSNYCLMEYEEAKNLARHIVPVRMEPDISLPDDLGRIQYADFAGRLFEDAMIDLIGDLGRLELSLRAEPLPRGRAALPTAAPQPASMEENPFNPAAVFHDAAQAYQGRDFETALRLANTLKSLAPDFLPDHIETLIDYAAHYLHEEAQQKEYLRVYEQVSLLARSDFTLDAARQLWGNLRREYPDVDHDPENLAERLSGIANILPPPFEWVEVPGGEVRLASRSGSYIPDDERVFMVERFMIAKYPITTAQYQVFLDAEDGYSDALWWNYSEQARSWRAEHPKPARPPWRDVDDHPRVNVSWFEAVAFCRWLSGKVGGQVRLPTEQEWQRAAQGDDGRDYPWGNDAPKSELANFGQEQDKTTPVERYPDGASPCGALDMAGNAWEWCVTDYRNGGNDTGLAAEMRVLRGGSWFYSAKFLRAAYRDWHHPADAGDAIGFRPALSYPKGTGKLAL